tara:strand:+ start:1185 stop:2378 length:1194 start_codon:yes stop_codon:yes gene_type:complete
MAISDFKYSDQDFFRTVCDYGKYLSRIHLKNFVVSLSDRWMMGSVGTKPSMVYFDGLEGTEVPLLSGSITAFASGSNTLVTSASHGLETGQRIEITGTTNYNDDSLVVTVIGANTFNIPTAFVSDDATGSWTMLKTTALTRIDTAKDWMYLTDEDELYIYVATASDDPNDDEVIEIGEDKDTFVNQALSNASQELNSLIYSHVTPIPKSFIYNNAEGTETPEYDYILKRAECLIAYSHLCSGGGDFELADSLYEKVTNPERTGIVDRINDGQIRLSYEREATDYRGRIIESTGNVGTMSLVELSGTWTGSRYDRVKVECTVSGAYGVAKIRVYTSSSTELYGTSSGENFVTGTMQTLAGGIYGRFEGNSLTSGDVFFFEVRNDEVTNVSAGSINLWR